MLLIDKLKGQQSMSGVQQTGPQAQTFSLVGAHFRPPAKALLEVLRQGTALSLVPEPDNPFDSNAIKVTVSRAVLRQLSPAAQTALAASLPLYGQDLADVLVDGPDWHLGYIARQQAAELAPALRGQTISGALAFAANGQPQVSATVPAAEPQSESQSNEGATNDKA